MRRLRRRLRAGVRPVLLGLMVLWFAVIAPGHQRGVIRLPGSAAPPMATCDGRGGAGLEPGLPSCCQPRTAGPVGKRSTGDDGDNDGPKRPGRDPAVGCAICQLLATLDAPLVLVWPDAFRLAPLTAADVRADQALSLWAGQDYCIRGPPLDISC